MMETPNNNIDTMRKYLNGDLPLEEKLSFEQRMSEDPFLADAVEGYRLSGASTSDLDAIKSKIVRKKRPRFRVFALTTGVAAAVTIVAIYGLGLFDNNLQKQGHTSQKTILQYDYAQPNNQTVDSIDSLPNYEPKNNTFTAEVRTMPRDVEMPESIAPLHHNRALAIDYKLPENELDSYYQLRSNHYFAYLGNFKVIDYRYDKRLNLKNNIIPTNVNDSETYSKELFSETKQYTYVAFLEDALLKLENKEYENAIDDFNIILEQYPNDLNAIFYKAMCFYETNDNSKSINLFEIALDNRINVFHEDSKWYSSMILKEEKEYAAAEKVLEEIVMENGYYGVQAKQELDELYKLYINE